MIVTGLVGALVRSRYKWGYFAFGCAALFYILYQLAWEARRHANALGKDIGRTFLICGSLTSLLWLLYPVAWGVCEGGNLIAPDSEAVFYGVLDFLAKPIFGALLIWGEFSSCVKHQNARANRFAGHRNIDPGRLGLRIRDYDEDPAIHSGTRSHDEAEKRQHPHPHGISNGATNGTHSTGNDVVTGINNPV